VLESKRVITETTMGRHRIIKVFEYEEDPQPFIDLLLWWLGRLKGPETLEAVCTAAAIHSKQAQREYTGGSAPYGWQVAADGAHVEPQRVEQAVIQEALRLKEHGLSLRKIGQALAAKGLHPRQGGGWHPQSVKYLLKAEVA